MDMFLPSSICPPLSELGDGDLRIPIIVASGEFPSWRVAVVGLDEGSALFLQSFLGLAPPEFLLLSLESATGKSSSIFLFGLRPSGLILTECAAPSSNRIFVPGPGLGLGPEPEPDGCVDVGGMDAEPGFGASPRPGMLP